MYVFNKITGMCNKPDDKKDASESPGDVELISENLMVKSPYVDFSASDIKPTKSELVTELYDARKETEFAASAQKISAIAAAAVSQIQDALAEVQRAQAEIFASQGEKKRLCVFLSRLSYFFDVFFFRPASTQRNKRLKLYQFLHAKLPYS